MPSPNEITVKLKTIADVSDVLENVKQIQNVLNKLKLPENVKANFDQLFKDIEKSGGKASSALAKGLNNKNNAKAYTQGLKELDSLTATLSKNFNKIDFSKLQFDIDPAKLKEVQQVIETLQKDLSNVRADALERVNEVMQKKPSGANAWKNFFTALSKGDEGIGEAEAALKRLNTELEKADNRAGGAGKAAEQSDKWRDYANAIQICQEALSVYKGETDSTSEKTQQLQQALEKLENLAVEANTEGAEAAKKFGGEIKKTAEDTQSLIEKETQVAQRTQDINSQLESFKNKAKYFFGMENAVRLFRQTLIDAFNTVKELDAVMTETAVVTDFSIGDMWSQLPEYTKRANALGVSIKEVYEASTLYYQQGLKTNQVMALTNETLKMARIGGLDAATATDRMTNALRGFNMEINELNAQRINDVYSKLAAISASDTDEISTAMTKVASLAHNANMEFETTSALLTQIIETTRESPETAGTALKTIIARFSEVKNLFSEGQLLGTDEEGEEINVNKVSEALRTAGINLNEYLTGAKGLDDIFLELSSKWDSLDQIQQRYIATMAAGSRQQSRFIAMMQDYNRTTELVNAANGAAGASEEQFNKTLDSLQTKLAQLKNAWQEFIMAIADNKIIGDIIDLLTKVLTTVNKLTGNNGLAKLAVAFGGLKLGGTILKKGILGDKGLAGLLLGSNNTDAATKKSIKGIINNFYGGLADGIIKGSNFLDKNKGSITKGIKNSISGAFNSAKQSLTTFKIIDSDKFQQGLQDELSTMRLRGDIDFNTFTNLNSQLQTSKMSLDEVNNALSGTGQQIQITEANAERFGATMTASNKVLQIGAGALIGIGAILQSVGDKLDQEGNNFGKILKGLGIALVAFGTIMSVYLPLQAQLAAKGITSAIVSIPIVGWIAGIISALIALVSVIHSFVKDNSAEGKLEAATEAADKAAEAANKAAEAYKNLSDSWDSLSDKYKALEDMTYGTEEWRKAVQEINSEVLDLMNKYDDLEVKMDENGVLRIENIENVVKHYTETRIKTSSAGIAEKIKVQEQEADKAYTDLVNNAEMIKIKTLDGYGNEIYTSSQDATEQVAREIASGNIKTSDELQEYLDANNLRFGVSSVEIIDATEFADLREYGEGLLRTDNKQQQLYTAMNSNAITLADIPDELSNEVTNFLDADKNKFAIEKATGELEKSSKARTLDTDESYKEYWEDQYGQGNVEISDKGKVKYKDENGKWQTIKAENAIEQYAGVKATEENAKAAEKFATNFNKLPDIQKKIYKENAGGALTKEDIKTITGKNYEDIKDDKDLSKETLTAQLKDKLSDEYDLLDDELQQAYGSKDEYIRQTVDAAYLAINAYKTAEQKLSEKGLALEGDAFNTLSSKSMKALSTKMFEILETSGEDGFEQIKNNFEKITEGLTDEEKETFSSILGSIDWKDADAIENLDEMLRALGFDTTKLGLNLEDFEQDLINVSEAVYNTDLTKVIEQLNTMASVADKIHSGNRSISTEEFELLTKAGIPEEKLFKMADGTYRFLGSSQEFDEEIYKGASAALTSKLHNISISSGQKQKQFQEEYGQLVSQIISTGNYNSIAAIDPGTLSIDQLKEYDEALIATGSDYPELEEEALKLRDATDEETKSILRLKVKSRIMAKSVEKDFENLTKTINDNLDTLKNAPKDSQKYQQALQDIASQARIAFSNDSIDTTFVEENLKDFEAIAKGDEGALSRIRQTILEDAYATEEASYGIKLDIQQLDGLKFDIDGTADFTSIMKQVEEAGGDLTEFKKLIESMGYTITEEQVQVGYLGFDVDEKGNKIKIPKYEIRTVIRDSAGNIVKGNKPPASSGSKSSKWENPYDELYNKVEESNEALRQRNKLENKYNDLLKSRASTQQEIQKAIFDEIANVRHEIDLQERLLAGRQKQLANAAQQTYTNDSGKTKTFKDWGVEKYAWYNTKTQQVEIDWAKINAIKDSATGSMVSAWIDLLKERENNVDEIEDTLVNMRNILDDLYERGMDSYLELEQRVYDALVDKQQKQIDELQNISDAIDDAMSEVIDGIQEQIDAERQARENQKTEEDIADKEARLAFLRRDTSGANALEIKQLEKEIEDAREGYSDTIIDQTIEQMQKDADLAAEQRNKQIELLEAQLEFDKENGTFNNLVRDLYLDATDGEGQFDMNSELVSLLQQTDAFKGMSEFAQSNWIKEMVEAFNNSTGGDVFAKLAGARALGEITTSSGQNLTYDTANKTWVDKNKSQYTLSWDANSGYTAEINQLATQDPVENHPYGYAKDLLTRTLRQGSTGDDVKLLQWILEQEGYDIGAAGIDGRYGPSTAKAVRAYQKSKGLSQDAVAGPKTRASIIALNKYANGGLAKFTGPAWLDGTTSKPELVLNAKDTQNFISLRDILASLFSQEAQKASQGDNYFDIKINADIGSDYDVSRLAQQIREEIYNDSVYRNVNTISHLR